MYVMYKDLHTAHFISACVHELTVITVIFTEQIRELNIKSKEAIS